MTHKLLTLTLFLGGIMLLVAFVSSKSVMPVVSGISSFYTVGVAHAWEGDSPADGCGDCGVGAGSNQGGIGAGDASGVASPGGCTAWCGGGGGGSTGLPAGAPASPVIACDASGNITYTGGWDYNGTCPDGSAQPTHPGTCADSIANCPVVYDSCHLINPSFDLSANAGTTAANGEFCPYVNINLYNGSTNFKSYTHLACSGTQTLSFSGTSGTSYEARIVDNQTGGMFGSTFFTGPACAVPPPTGAPIPPPTTMGVSCNAASNQVTLNWTDMSAQGATKYYPRIWVPVGVSCASGWSDAGGNTYGHTCYKDSVTSTAVTYPVTAGTQYSAWVHAGDPIQTDSSGVGAVTIVSPSPFSCNSVAPAAPTPLTAVCDASGAQVTLSWPTVTGATTYVPGLFLPLGAACPVGWTSTISGGYNTCRTTMGGTSVTVPVPANTSVTGVVYAGNTAGFSAGTTQNFTCTNGGPTATLTGEGCVLPAGGGTCNISLHWVASGTQNDKVDLKLTLPNLSVVTAPIVGILSLVDTTGATSHPTSFLGLPADPDMTVPAGVAGTYTFKMYDNGTSNQIGSALPLVACPPGNTIVSGACVPPPDTTASGPTPPTVSLSGPNSVLYGNKATLTWVSTNATQCTAVGGFDTGGRTNGSAQTTAPLTAATNYQVNCTGPGGSKSALTTVQVTSPNAHIDANPSRVISGGHTTVSWSASDVTKCDITKNRAPWKMGILANAANVVVPDSADEVITGQTVYTMTCDGASGSTSVNSIVVNLGTQGFQEF